ncbi:hypothetical protein C1H46_001976 [Malus baccata]|uniref:Plastocyanin-like domain-containing protein n=1 Tax=Malus baccata TaxID=106549 RepID=A0A540NNY6_MALBA|nr:hypothetical protein C1H46_001976 [Malus baccata]
MPSSCLFKLVIFLCSLGFGLGADPYVFYDWTVSYITASPLGVKQRVIGINGQFPGPILNVTTNWNVVVNVKNNLDEPLLLTWNGIQNRKNSWQDGVSGTNCPIHAGWNWTYEFQVKDQIGSFFYFPSLNFQRASGGYGGITINNRNVIPLPFTVPDGDITLFITDWYTKSHKDLRKDVESGTSLGIPDGVLINGIGPFRFDQGLIAGGNSFLTVNVEPGKTYRFRVHNVGISTSLNFRIQNHNLLLVETEGSYTVQQNYANMDIHVGQWNVSAGAARPNPQGSFKYGEITVTDVYVILNRPAELINGKWRTTLNGISYIPPSTPLKLAQQFNISGVYKLDFPNKLMNRPAKVDTSLINGTFKGFMEVIFQNNDTTVQNYHLDGYAFFIVGMDIGVWTENSRSTYNKWDGVARSTTQVFPGSWTAILVVLDNAGIWNLRAQNLDSWYLGQEVYVSVVNPEFDGDEHSLPDNTIYCGLLSSLQKDQTQRGVKFSSAPSITRSSTTILVMLIIACAAFIRSDPVVTSPAPMFPSVVSPPLPTSATQPRVLLLGDVLGFWVTVKVLCALFGRIMGALLTARVARSPPFFVDPVTAFGSLFGGGGFPMEAR